MTEDAPAFYVCTNCRDHTLTLYDSEDPAGFGWGYYNMDGSFRTPTDEILGKPGIYLCEKCNTPEILGQLVYGDDVCPRCGMAMQATHHPLCETDWPDATTRAAVALWDAMQADELAPVDVSFVTEKIAHAYGLAWRDANSGPGF